MDDPKLDARQRTAILETLDGFNRLLGSYDHWFETLRRFLQPDHPTTVLDLASGHAGFALAVARLARRAGLPVQMIASDLHREYIEIGAAVAAREGLDVRFREQDALDLRALAENPPDVVTCTQALHHFPPGWVSRIFDEAARVARRGVLFVDGCRTMMHVPLVMLWGHGVCRVPGFSHDAFISLRRFFSVEELDLLANVVPRPWQTEARLVGPCHVALALAK